MVVDNKMLDKVAKPFNVDLPEAEGLYDMLDKVLPAIRQHSEDIREEEYFLRSNWIELRDDEDFHEVILHVFDDGGEYVRSTNGNIECGEWRNMNGKFVYGPSSCDGEVFDLAFLDEEFFILKKHGNSRLFERRYHVFIIERLHRLEWNEAVEYLFDKYRNSNGFLMTAALLLLVVIVLALLLS